MLCILNVGTVPTLCILYVGTVPMLCILNVGTVPTFSHSLNFDQFMEVIQYTKLDVCFLFLLIKYDTLKSILSKP